MKQKRLQTILQVCMIVILLSNTLGPLPVKAANASQPAGQGQPPEPNSLPIVPTEYYNTNVKPPSSVAAKTTAKKPRVPAQSAKRLLDFRIESENGSVALNEIVTLKVTIRNNSAIVQEGLHFVDALKNGFVYVPDRTSPVQYDAVRKQVTYDAVSLKGGQALTFQYKVKITTRLQKSSLGEVRLHNASLSTTGGQPVIAQTALMLGNSQMPKKSYLLTG